MTFFKFNSGDIIHTTIKCFPSYVSELNGNIVTGSVFLEQPYLETNLRYRIFKGFSQKEGGLIVKTGSMSASIDFQTAVSGGTNSVLWHAVNRLYDYYSLENSSYSLTYLGTKATTVKVISIPEIYYDQKLLTGSFTGSDNDSAGAGRLIYDNGRGGLFSGSVSGTLVGNIFYNEGIAVITKTGLTDFGTAGATNFRWRVFLKGVHEIPVKIFKCLAPASQLNATTNPTFYTVPASGTNKNLREVVSSSLSPYVTKIGLYDDLFNLVAVANLTQPVKKDEKNSILFKIRLDW